jgi:hypothetical protein
LSTDEKLAEAMSKLAGAIDRNSRVMEIMIEAMPAATEAKILGVSDRTIRRARKVRRNLRLLTAS